MGQKHLNAWGWEVEDLLLVTDPYAVPEDERLDTDEGELSTAFDELTGDDLDGWVRGDPV